MDALSAITLVRPQALWCLALLPLLAAWWWRRRRRDTAWRDVVDAHLLPHLIDGGARDRGARWRLALLLAGAALAVLALAGPSWRSVPQPLHATAAPLVVVLDLSSAMAANDLPPSRLAQARVRLAELLRERAGGQVGLVVYAEDAFTVAPITDDAANVALFLDALQPSVMPVDGARPSRGIGRARMLLAQAGFDRGAILLMTSAADGAADDAAREAAAAGYTISVLGLGTARGAAFRRPSGEIASTALDAGGLRAVAAAGNGRYVALGAGDLAALGLLRADATGDAIAPAESSGSTSESARVPLDGGFWLLPPLMLLALLAFRRGAPIAVLACVLCWPAMPVRAQAEAPASAGRADGEAPAPPRAAGGGDAATTPAPVPVATPWLRRDQAEHRAATRAETAYRAGDFAGAARAWAAVPGAEADYNRGNALARAGRYEDAIAAYDDALAESPRGHADATANRAAVAAAMQRRPPPGPRDGSRGDQSQDGDGGKPKPDPSAGESGDSGAQGDARDAQRADAGDPPDRANPPQSGSQDGDPSPSPQSPPQAQSQADQRAADDAQRARMRAAGAGGDDTRQSPAGDGQRAQGDPERSESQADRERRRAQEAWLRRVPDDPGALLRARFLLEHERRERGGGP